MAIVSFEFPVLYQISSFTTAYRTPNFIGDIKIWTRYIGRGGLTLLDSESGKISDSHR